MYLQLLPPHPRNKPSGRISDHTPVFFLLSKDTPWPVILSVCLAHPYVHMYSFPSVFPNFWHPSYIHASQIHVILIISSTQSSFFNSDLCPQIGDDSRLFCRVNSSLCLRRDSGHCGHSTDWRAACCNVAARQLVVKKWKPVGAAGEPVHTSWWLCKPRSVCTLPPLLHNLHNFTHF